MSARSLVVTSILAMALAVAPAAAETPNQAFNGKIILSPKKFPQQAKSPGAYIAAVRKLSTSNFYEDKTSHNWKVYFAAFLKAPLNDVEYVLKVYELTGKSQQLLTTADQYTDERGQRTVIANITLDKKLVGVNKQLMMTIESKGKVLASGQLKILGEGERFSGKVNFSDEEAQGKEKDE
ncbi:MAG: hypothetical protein JWO36_768 [Myxococcales bacterium]|nr:hypothetical protein [Myxococcales bacterium]